MSDEDAATTPDSGYLAAGTRVTTSDGYFLAVENVEAELSLLCSDQQRLPVPTAPSRIQARGRKPVLRVLLDSHDEITATADHLLRTRRGWTGVGELKIGDFVAVNPFLGLVYETAAGETIECANAFAQEWLKANPELKVLALWPLQLSDLRFPALLRILGYCAGGGSLSASEKGLRLHAETEMDATDLAADIRYLGFQVRTARRKEKYSLLKALTRPESEHKRGYTISAPSPALHLLLTTLGCPEGAWESGLMPWIFELPAWMRAHFLSAFLSAAKNSDENEETLSVFTSENSHSVQFVRGLLLSLNYKVTVSHERRLQKDRVYTLKALGSMDENVRLWREIGFCRAEKKRAAVAQAFSEHLANIAGLWQQLAAIFAPTSSVDAAFSRVFGNAHTTTIFEPKVATSMDTAVESAGADGEIAWVAVAAVEDTPTCEVYEIISNDAISSFAANGIISRGRSRSRNQCH